MPEALSVPIILWHPDGKRVARQGSAWPTLKLAPDQELTAQLRAAWQVESWLLHDGGLAYGVTGSPRFEGLGETLPAGLSWQEVAVPELRLARPWHQLGWPAKAQALLREAGLSGTLRQVSSSDLNTVLRVETPQGTAYLKKSHSPREMQATAHLERHFPDLGPKVLGLSETENWQILASGGALLDSVGDLGAWTEALERLATFQTSAKAQAWAALGCPIYPLADMQEKVSAFIGDTTTLQGWGLDPKTIAALQAARPDLERAFGEVAALGLPELPAHGDAHPRNALHGERGSLWFDWSEAAFAHPFMDVGWFLAFVLHPKRHTLPIRTAQPDLQKHLAQAYLRALGCPDAEQVLDKAIPLALLHRAAVYDQQFRHWQGSIADWRPNYTPYYLRLAAGELGRLTPMS